MNKERYWTFILYPKETITNWKEYLQETGLEIAISPLHNKDKNPNGEIKKEHYHILICFNGPTTYNRVLKITQDLKSPIPKRVLSVKGMIRYFSHKDNPEKEQYDENEITTINGMDIKNVDGLTLTMIENLKKEVIQIIRNQEITEYSVLINELIDNKMYDMLEVVSKNTIYFNAYLKSKKYIKIESQKV